MEREPPDISDDAILNGRLRLFQPKRGHRFGHDAILLAACVPAAPGARFAEFGAGVGAASLALLSRMPQTEAVLIEIDPNLAALAKDNIARNGFADRGRAIALDVTASERDFAQAGLLPSSFDHVLMNPPFNDAAHQPSPDAGRRRAHAGETDSLQRWIASAHHFLKDSGAVTLIWRAEGLRDVLEALTGFGSAAVVPVYPSPGHPAIRIIVSAQKGARSPLRILPSLTLNDSQQRPTDDAEAILRHGGGWPPNVDEIS